MKFSMGKVMLSTQKVLEFLNSPDFYIPNTEEDLGRGLSDAEKLVVLKTAVSAIENALAVEAMLTVYKISFDNLGKK
jgi:hypothetical protein